MKDTNEGGTAADYSGMSLKHVEQRRGQRGRPVSPGTIARMRAIVDEIAHHPLAITARHLFYRLVGRSVIEKTEKDYEHVLDDLLALRRSGDVPWNSIVDGTRTKTGWQGFYGSLDEALADLQRTYRRDPWRTNPVRCEVWSESRGLLDTVNAVAGQYGVTTLGLGGFASASVGWETARAVKAACRRGQAYVIFHFGDHDPSGRAIGYTAERDIRSHLTDDEQRMFTFKQVALTREQVIEYDLPSAPVKRRDDGSIKGGHASDWLGGTTELDALDPVVLQRMVRESIESVLDPEVRAATRVAESSDLAAIDRILVARRTGS